MVNPKTMRRVLRRCSHGYRPIWPPGYRYLIDARNYTEREVVQVYPLQAKALSKDDFKTIVTSFLGIGLGTEGIGISECERVSCEVLWIHEGAGESILDDFTVIDFECDCVVRCVLISQIHLAELCRGILKGNMILR